MTKTLLSNYMLGIALMKNIAMKFSGNYQNHQNESMAQISRILEIESRYGLNSQSPELGIGFLVNQHIKEILDKNDNASDVIQLTFTKEFNNMLQVCLFVPFLHPDTPRPASIPKSELKLDYLKPKADLMASILQMRQQILQSQTTTQNEIYSENKNQLMSNIPEMASIIEDEDYHNKASKNSFKANTFDMNGNV